MKKVILAILFLIPFLLNAQDKIELTGVGKKLSSGAKLKSLESVMGISEVYNPIIKPLGSSKNAFNLSIEEDVSDVLQTKKAKLKSDFDLQLTLPGQDNLKVMIPESQLPQEFIFNATVTNIGVQAAANVILQVKITDNVGNTVYEGGSDALPSLEPNVSSVISTNSICTINSIGEYTVTYTVSCDQEDGDTSDNVDYRWISANKTVFAYEHDNAKLSAANFYTVPAILGQKITMSATDTLTSISFRTYSAVANTEVRVAVAKVGVNDTTIIAISDDYQTYNISLLVNDYKLNIDRMIDSIQNFRGVVLYKDSSYIIGVYGQNIPLAYTTVYTGSEMLGRTLDDSESWTVVGNGITPIIRANFDKVLPLKNNDLGIASVASPKSVFSIPQNLNVSVNLKNYGSTTISSGFQINYRLNDGIVVTETYAGADIAPFATTKFTFSDTLPFFKASENNFKIWTSLVGDGYHDNDTFMLTSQMINTRFSQTFEINSYNYDFTNRVGPWTTVDNDLSTVKSIYVNNQLVFWYGLGSGNSGKRAFQIFTPSKTSPVTTEIFTPHSGNCIGYVPCPAGQADDWLISPKVRLNTNSLFTFLVKGIEGFDERFKVLVSTTDNVLSSFKVISGDDPLTATSEWSKIEVSLAGYDNQEVYVALNYVSNDQLLLLVDDVNIVTDYADFVDVAVTSVTSPTLLVDTLLTVNIKNNGNLELSSGVNVSYSINNGEIITAPFTGYPISALSQKAFSFPTNVDMTTPGVYNFKVWASIANDSDAENDTIEYSVTINPMADSLSLDFENMYAFTDNFYPWESRDGDQSTCYRLGSISQEFVFPNTGTAMGFIAFAPDGTTPSSSDYYNAHTGNKFGASIGVWNPTYQSNDWLISPKILIKGPNAYIQFWAKSASSSTERMNVLISTTDKLEASFIVISTADTINVPGEWTQYTYSLNNYIDQEIYAAIQSVTYNGHILMIDDIKITNGEADKYDAAVTQIIAPVVPSPKDPLTDVSIKVKVSNLGNKALDGSSITVAYSLDGATPVKQSFGTGTIAWTKSTSFTFDSKVNVEQAGIHILKVWTEMANETDVTNDTTTVEIKINQTANPYFLDFEDFYDFTTLFTPWSNIDFDQVSSTVFTISGGSTLTYPGLGEPQAFMAFNPSACEPAIVLPAHSGEKFGMVFRSVGAANNDWLISPQLQMLDGESTITLWARGYSTGELFDVMVSENGPDTNNFVSLPGQLLSSQATWTEYSFSLNGYKEKPVHIAIRCVSDDQIMFMVDDIEVSTTVGIDDKENVDVNIYPNPAKNVITITSDSKILEYKMLNTLGNIEMQSLVNGYNVVINKINLSQGVYFILVKTDNGWKSAKVFFTN